MNHGRIVGIGLLAGLLVWVAARSAEPTRPAPADPLPAAPAPDARPLPKKLRPWLIEASVGGGIAPDGKTEVHCDLPGAMHRQNTSSKGLGLCVFTSIHHSGLWQEVPSLVEFPKWLVDKGIPGGGYPSKVEELIPKVAKERGLPTPSFMQVESKDLEILKLACKTGRMPGVTYSRSPTGRYSGQTIAHMVSLVHADDQWFAILDNNYVGADKLEWMTPAEFLRTYTGGSNGWAVILLDNGPPPVPRN